MTPVATPAASSLLAPLALWFDAHRRDLPWRAERLDFPHPNPYAVLVSELMLQQTQVATVIPYFTRWMARFPDPQTLAQSSDEDIHRHWQGLGYYRRAAHLKAAANELAQHGWPQDFRGLERLPGVGPYTAAALASIAFLKPEPALDGNAFRVLARLQGLRQDPRTCASELREWLRPALAAHGPSRMTQAIMELGALVCTPSPRCTACPLAQGCAAALEDLTGIIPPPKARATVREISIWLLAIHSTRPDEWLLHPPQARGLLAGLWRWPSIEFTGSREAMAESAAEDTESYGTSFANARAWSPWVQTYTHRREQVHPHMSEIEEKPEPVAGLQWVSSARLCELPMGKRDQRLRALLSQPDAREAESSSFPPLSHIQSTLFLD